MINDTNTITLAKAQKWATKYRLDPSNTIKAYLIPEADIKQLYAKTDVVDVRAYMGIDEEGIQKLMLVGVDATGNDLIDSKSGHYIYDFTAPCPTMCSVNSPLFTLIPQETHGH